MQDVRTGGEQDWAEFRRLMPVARKLAYFDHAAVAPLPDTARQAIGAWADESTEEGDTVAPAWYRRVEQVRQQAATMIGAAAEEIALVPNTTAGINLVAEGYPWRAGDNVVTLANEFPSNLYPWMNLADRGVETRCVPAVDDVAVDLNRLAEACDEHTRIISISWVGYASGWRIDLDELVQLALDKGVRLFLDAIQGMGVFPLDVRRTPIDFLAADGHKWMLGPEGLGVFYLRREHLNLLRPMGVGWHSVVHSGDFSHIELDLRNEAARYEGGTCNTAGILGFGASLDLLARFGLTPRHSPLAERILEITDLACQRLEQAGARVISDRTDERRSGIVAFDLPGRDLVEVRKHCPARGVVLSYRGGRLRISPHAYTDESDVERLIEALE